MADTVETLKIKVVAETASAEKGLNGLKSKVESLAKSLGKGAPGGGASGGAAGAAAKGLNAATQILGGSIGSLTGMLGKLGPKGVAIAAAIALATKAIQQATKASQELISYMTQLVGKIDMGTTAMRQFNEELTKTARNSSVSKTDLGKFFTKTKNSFTDVSQMERDAEFAKQLISYYGDIDTAAKAYNRTLAMDLDMQKDIRKQMQIQYNLTQDSGEAGLKAIKQELSEILETLGSMVLQVLNPTIQAIKVILGALNSVLQIVKNIVGAFSGITGSGTMADAMMDGAEATGEASKALDQLNDEMDLYNGKLSGLDEVTTMDSGDSFGMADNPLLDGLSFDSTLEGLGMLTQPLNFISNTFEKVADILENVIYPILKPIKEFIDGISVGTAGMFDTLFEMLDTVLTPIGEIIGSVAEIVGSILQPVLSLILNLLNSVFKVLGTIFGTVGKILSSVMNLLKTVLQPIFDLVDMIVGFVAEIFGGVEDTNDALTTTATGPLAFIGDLVSFIVDLITKIVDFLMPAVHAVIKTLKSLLDPILKIFQSIFDIIEGIVTLDFKKIFSGVVNILIGMVNFIIEVLNGIIEAVNWITLSNVFGGGWNIPKIPKVKYLAEGGSAITGELVNIRENGPELVSYGSGKMEVMNNDQIMQSVAQGVAQALQGVDLGGGGNFNFYMDGQEMNVRLEKARQRTGTKNIGSKVRQGGY